MRVSGREGRSQENQNWRPVRLQRPEACTRLACPNVQRQSSLAAAGRTKLSGVVSKIPPSAGRNQALEQEFANGTNNGVQSSIRRKDRRRPTRLTRLNVRDAARSELRLGQYAHRIDLRSRSRHWRPARRGRGAALCPAKRRGHTRADRESGAAPWRSDV